MRSGKPTPPQLRKTFQRLWWSLFVVAASLLTATPAAAGRVALVIGNSAYENVDRLPNPEDDARAVAAALERMGFDSVTLRLNQNQSEMRRALGDFAAQAAGADVAMLYYAGHGIEVSGQNYLIPVDARLAGAGDVDFETIDLSTAMVALERANGLKLLILDACRDNPFRSRLQRGGATRSVSRGLARVEPTGRDIVVAYAAREGAVASDGDGANSPYTTALLKHLETPGLDVRLLFGKVRDDVVSATGGNQEPYIYESLGGDVVALAKAEATATAPPASTEAPTADRDALYWSSVKDSSDPALIRSYLERYPNGEFAVLAHARLQALEPAENPQPQETTPNPADESFRQAQAADAAGNMAEAVRLYRSASDQGHARATALLGYAYEYGRGVAQDDDEAFRLFSRAAGMEDVQGKFSLAWAFNNGKGTPADPKKSAALFLEVLRSGENSAFYVKVLSDFRGGLQRATIRAMQEEMKAGGLYQGPLDGDLGPTTLRALNSVAPS